METFLFCMYFIKKIALSVNLKLLSNILGDYFQKIVCLYEFTRHFAGEMTGAKNKLSYLKIGSGLWICYCF